MSFIMLGDTWVSIGIHLIGDLKGVSPSKISKVNFVKGLMESAVKNSGLSKIRSYYHQFSPDGVSGIILLAESHLSFHTWPEYGFVALDIFTCGPTEHAEAAFQYILEKLSPISVEYRKVERGLEFPRGIQRGSDSAMAVLPRTSILEGK
ncbi:MAG: adenosylmethionine decarboxylase [Thermoplasmatales archaeon]